MRWKVAEPEPAPEQALEPAPACWTSTKRKKRRTKSLNSAPRTNSH
jgi:hypothetical protein